MDVTLAASGNVDAVAIDATTLDSLPVFDRDYVATLSRFLDTGSLGNAGATVVMNANDTAASLADQRSHPEVARLLRDPEQKPPKK